MEFSDLAQMGAAGLLTIVMVFVLRFVKELVSGFQQETKTQRGEFLEHLDRESQRSAMALDRNSKAIDTLNSTMRGLRPPRRDERSNRGSTDE